MTMPNPILEALFNDPIADLPVTGPMIRKELDLIDRQLRYIAAKRRKGKVDLSLRDALEARRLKLNLRIPR
jgi:hypothetical protein